MKLRSYDGTDRYQSSPLFNIKSIQVINQQDENMRTKLNLSDNHQVKELCLNAYSQV